MRKSQFKPGAIVGRYRVVKLLGTGGMGEVYEAFEDGLSRAVALKVISRSAIGDQETFERFKGEGRALARLTHPSIVSVYSLFEHGEGRLVMAMEFVDGMPLDHYMSAYPCGLGDVVEIFAQILAGLVAAHSAGIIHRDLKPQNIVIGKDLTVKLIDFGVAKVQSDQKSVKTSADMIMGTVHYLPPEILNGHPVTVQADLYAAGLLLYFMLTGRIPHEGRNNFEVIQKIRSESLTLDARLEHLIPAELTQLLRSLIAKDPKDRQLSASEALDQLRQVPMSVLPEEIRRSVRTNVLVVNQSEVRARCEEMGYDFSEINIILGLSIEEHGISPGTSYIEVSDASLGVAIEKFEFAKRMILPAEKIDSESQVSKVLEASTGVSKVGTLPPPLATEPVENISHLRLTRARAVNAVIFLGAVILTLASMQLWTAFTSRVSVSVPLPAYRAGETFVFKVKIDDQEYVETWTVEKVENGLSTWVSDKGSRELWYPNRLVSPIKVWSRTGMLEREEVHVGDHFGIFPLIKGNQHAIFRSIRGSNGETLQDTHRCDVGTGEPLSGKDGQTLKVSCSTDSGRKENFYFVPEVKHWIFNQGEQALANGQTTRWQIELIESVSPDQPRSPSSNK